MNTLFSLIVPVLNEKERVVPLLKSIFNQNYRPLETVIVDGGSRDGTPAVVANLAEKLNSDDFTVTLIIEKASRPNGNVAFAKNLGIGTSHGDNVLLIDADFVLSQADILGQLAEALRNHDVAYFETHNHADTWLEYQLILDGEAPLFRNNNVGGWAFKRWVLKKFRFDDSLAFGEDMDFISQLAKSDLTHPNRISAVGLRHFPHTLRELRKQKLWYGRTALSWVKKHHSPREMLVLSPLVAFNLLVLQLVGYAFSIALGVTITLAFLSIPLVMLSRSTTRNLKRTAYLVFVRTIYGSFFFTLGFVQGIFQLLLRGHIHMSRD